MPDIYSTFNVVSVATNLIAQNVVNISQGSGLSQVLSESSSKLLSFHRTTLEELLSCLEAISIHKTPTVISNGKTVQ